MANFLKNAACLLVLTFLAGMLAGAEDAGKPITVKGYVWIQHARSPRD